MNIPNIWKNKKCSKPPTSLLLVLWQLHKHWTSGQSWTVATPFPAKICFFQNCHDWSVPQNTFKPISFKSHHKNPSAPRLVKFQVPGTVSLALLYHGGWCSSCISARIIASRKPANIPAKCPTKSTLGEMVDIMMHEVHLKKKKHHRETMFGKILIGHPRKR